MKYLADENVAAKIVWAILTGTTKDSKNAKEGSGFRFRGSGFRVQIRGPDSGPQFTG